jgi:flagellar biosynthesis/type III secretory pathway M-ring protein FliF/YscJ
MTNNWRLWAIGMVMSLILFAVVYFTVIMPSQNAANQALKSGLQQSQQVINQAQKQLKSSGAGTAAVGAQAQKQLSQAQKLTACVQSAGTDVSAIASCQTKFGK